MACSHKAGRLPTSFPRGCGEPYPSGGRPGFCASRVAPQSHSYSCATAPDLNRFRPCALSLLTRRLKGTLLIAKL